MSTQSTNLYIPADVTRPLYRAVIVLCAFLVAVGIWATQALFATTLKVPGETGSTAPSFEIQHPLGGQIQSVAVQLHDHVQAGDLLFQIDTRENDLRADALRVEKRHHEAVLGQIAMRLTQDTDMSIDTHPSVNRAYTLKDAALLAQIQSLEIAATTAREQIKHLAKELATLGSLQTLLDRRVERVTVLQSKGLTTEQASESSRERALENAAHIAAKRSTIIALQDSAETSDRQASLLRLQEHANLADLELRTQRELAKVELELEQLSVKQEQAQVRAPVSGEITQLPYRAAGLIARAGVTLAVVSQRFAQPYVVLHVQPNYIDQVSIGQKGQVMIAGLPTRETPKLHVTLTAVSDQPVLDGNGQTLHYLARAEIDADDLERARAALGERFQLAHGMPISAILNGDQTTMWSFLAGPLGQIWSTALED